MRSVRERFESHILVEHDSTCWLWSAYTTPTGYGRFQLNDKACIAHRVSYELYVGPIPEGLELDHLCRVRNCVNPSHLEPVTKLENWRRGLAPSRLHAQKTECKSGHPFTPENTYVWRGFRFCRTCNLRHAKARKRRLANQ